MHFLVKTPVFKKTQVFNIKFHVFQKLPYIQNFPFEKPGFYTKTPVLTQNSTFFKNFRTFKKFSVQETEF